MRFLLLCLILVSAGCTPAMPPLVLEKDCQAVFTQSELLAGHWLLRPGTWRIRQSALLEMGHRKIPMEGFLRLDLKHRQARLLAMNEMGLVLFDLEVTPDQETLHRVLPQLQQVKGLASGVAQSLRQIFLQPVPHMSDRLEQGGNSLRLWRPLPAGSLGFLFDCQGDLRETRYQQAPDDWRVLYNRYQQFGKVRLPEEIVMNDDRHKVKLSLWLREVKQEP